MAEFVLTVAQDISVQLTKNDGGSVQADPIPVADIAGGGAPLSNVWFVDVGTAVAPANQNGAIGSPFSTMTAAIAAAQAAALPRLVLRCTPGDYTAETTLLITTDMHLSIVCEAVSYAASASPSVITPPRQPLTPLAAPNINYGAANSVLLLQGVLIGLIDGFGSASDLYLSNCTASVIDVGANNIYASGSYIAAGVTCGQLFCDSTYAGVGPIDASIAAYFTDSLTAAIITSPTITWDAYSYAVSRDSGATQVGAQSRCPELEKAIITVTIPAMTANEDQELVVSFVGTELETRLLAGDVVAVAPSSAMPTGAVIASVVVGSPSGVILRIVATTEIVAPVDIDFTFVRLLSPPV